MVLSDFHVGGFKIRKCCGEKQVILESTSECVEFDLLKMNRHIYHHENGSFGEMDILPSGEPEVSPKETHKRNAIN